MFPSSHGRYGRVPHVIIHLLNVQPWGFTPYSPATRIMVQAKLMPWFNGKRIQMGTSRVEMPGDGGDMMV